jgi:predicted component of type VI protein secretion system
MEQFEEQFQAIGPRFELNGDTFSFQSIEDFHPDHLLQQSSSLSGLMEQYRSIKKEGNQSPYFQALVNGATPVEAPGENDPADSEKTDVFAELLGGERPANHASAPPKDPAVDQLVQSALQGSKQISSKDSNQVEWALEQLESKLSSGLSQILHHPKFQALEARWRQLDRLMASLEDDSGADIRLLPLNAAQCQSWLDRPELAVATIQQQLELLGGADALFFSHHFGSPEKELNLLQQLSSLAAAIGTPLITSGSSELIGHATLPQQFGSHEAQQIEGSPWSQLKTSLKLDHLYITIQRVLTRLPYNPKDDPIDSFAYAEDAQPLQPNELLRGDAALIIARLWLEHFIETASPTMPPAPRTLDDCPLYTVDRQLLPVAECWLSDEAANVLQSHGWTPLRSTRNSRQISVYL